MGSVLFAEQDRKWERAWLHAVHQQQGLAGAVGPWPLGLARAGEQQVVGWSVGWLGPCAPCCAWYDSSLLCMV